MKNLIQTTLILWAIVGCFQIGLSQHNYIADNIKVISESEVIAHQVVDAKTIHQPYQDFAILLDLTEDQKQSFIRIYENYTSSLDGILASSTTKSSKDQKIIVLKANKNNALENILTRKQYAKFQAKHKHLKKALSLQKEQTGIR